MAGLAELISTAQKRRIMLIAGVLIGLMLGLLWSLLQTPRYRSSAVVLIDAGSPERVLDIQTGGSVGARAVTNEARFAESDVVNDVVIEKLSDLGITEDSDNYETSVMETGDADELTFYATAETADGAAQAAQIAAESYIELSRNRAVDSYSTTARALQARIEVANEELAQLGSGDRNRAEILESEIASFSSLLSSLNVTAELGGMSRDLITRAKVPEAPYSPWTTLNAFIGVVLGLGAAIGLAVILESLDTRIKSKDDLEDAAPSIPNLAVIPTLRDWRERSTTRIVTVESPSSPPAEAYRVLRTALEFARLDGDVKVIQVTSGSPGEGKTTTVVNLAVALSRAGRNVVLIDADLRKPRVHTFFGIPMEPGFTNAILGQAAISQIGHIAEHDAGTLTVVPSGPLPPGPSELLNSPRTAAVLAELSAADVVLLDSAPVLPASDALVLARKADATLLLASGASTRHQDLKTSVELLAQVDANVIGTVLNQVVRSTSGYGYGYGYGYGVEST